ncbi:MAG: inorganic phosphate transporter [Mediterranea sp.]|jgi:phosphate/sulfate permease|nr:inorganic phosphate transporter [Mediterranea sp.]
MDTLYFIILIILFGLAVFDIMVGVSNDACNFLNSAIGAKAASFKLVMVVAAAGIFVGAAFSNGMMDIARHGIYQPQHFYFAEIMCIVLAVMITDVVLLDAFNSMGMPTSTTVSMVFELLGGTFALAMIKVFADGGLQMGDLINTDKALSVVMAIFISVAIAFFFGVLIQYLARIIFTFGYKKKMKYAVGLFGGFAATAIFYFMVIKGLKDSSFMTAENKLWIDGHTGMLVGYCFLFFTLLMQTLHWLKVNVFKVIVLLGTFALALAFAGNDLVNFIGVPLAGYSAYTDFISQGPAATPDNFLMTSLLGSAKTPWYFLAGAGLVMVYALFTSKKAQHVIKTSVDLSRQEEGEESFGSTPIARKVVRMSLSIAHSMDSWVPEKAKQWINSRFCKDEAIIADGGAFDLVRAAVNLVVASLLIALGTSLKLPLSTTYVTFMVAMGSSLADRAWGRDSAVFRITGVLSVVGGWFLTAGIAFTISFFVALLIYYGGTVATIVLILLAVLTLLRSHVLFSKKKTAEQHSETVKLLLQSKTGEEALQRLQVYTCEERVKLLQFAEENFNRIVTSFFDENLRGLRKATGAIKFEKQLVKQMRRIGASAISRLDSNMLIEKGLYYYQGNDFALELVYSMDRMCEPVLEHTDNNFNPLDSTQKEELNRISQQIFQFIHSCREKTEKNDYEGLDQEIKASNVINNQLSVLKREELKRIQNQSGSIKVSMVYLTMLQEAQNVVMYIINIMKVSRKFQANHTNN